VRLLIPFGTRPRDRQTAPVVRALRVAGDEITGLQAVNIKPL
jgi:hypothetical protein